MFKSQMTREHLLSIDLEDWHTSAFLRQYVRPEAVVHQLEQSTPPILDLLAELGASATFFILGSAAEAHPALIKRIAAEGHEIASHGYSHTPLWDLTPDSFRAEIVLTNRILQDLTGHRVKGFRAPYCSLQADTAWMLDVLEEEGFAYDSSMFPLRTTLYGVNGAPVGAYRISSADIMHHSPSAKLLEIPFTVFQQWGLTVPCTGGVYGRLLPFRLLQWLLQQTARYRPINFYFHPWETSAHTPRLNVPWFNRFITYYNNEDYLPRVRQLGQVFRFTSFEKYLAQPQP
jgi:polysaccharide deacetylase family protein (PEP-CTERM system associated)